MLGYTLDILTLNTIADPLTSACVPLGVPGPPIRNHLVIAHRQSQ